MPETPIEMLLHDMVKRDHVVTLCQNCYGSFRDRKGGGF